MEKYDSFLKEKTMDWMEMKNCVKEVVCFCEWARNTNSLVIPRKQSVRANFLTQAADNGNS